MKLHDAAGLAAKRVAGVADKLHTANREVKPIPLTVTTVLATPFDGVSVMLGTSVKLAITVSPPGSPVTVTVHGEPSDVAVDVTLKSPVPVPPLTEHDGDAMSIAPLGPRFDVTLHPVSVKSKPLATKEIVLPGDPNDGVRVSSVATVTWKVSAAVSPKVPATVTVKVLPVGTGATMKKVPVIEAPPS